MIDCNHEVAPVDDPSRHQGRTRARPWVQGEYPAHVYLEREYPAGRGLLAIYMLISYYHA